MAARRRVGSFSPKTSRRLRISNVAMLYDMSLSPLDLALFPPVSLTLKDTRKRGPHPPSRKKPQDRNDDRQRQTRRRLKDVEAKYVENHGPQNRQCHGHVAICEQQDRGYYLQQKNDHVEPRYEERAEELSGDPRGRRHGNKMKEAVESERQKDQTQ